MTNMNWRIALVTAALAIVLSGCVGAGTGQKISPPDKAYANVVSLSPSTTEIMAGAGGGYYLVGRTSECDRPQSVLEVDVVMTGTQIDTEAILATNPDLIIYDTMLFNDDSIAMIEKMGIDTLSYSASSIKEYEDFGTRLASKLGIEMYMSNYMDKVYREMSVADSHDTGDPRTGILLGSAGSNSYMIAGTDGIHADLIKVSGGTPVGPTGQLFLEVKIESLIDMDPEIIFTDGSAVQIMKDQRLQGITAVRERRVYDVDSKTLVRIGGNLNELITGMGTFLRDKPRAQIEGDE